MRSSVRHVLSATALVGIALVVAGAVPAVAARPESYLPRPPQVIVWRVTTLDAAGRLAHVYGPGSTIRLRIQWIVRGAAPGAHQTTMWIVSYAGKEILRVARTSMARDGNWSRETTITVTRRPHIGPHVFWGRASVSGVSSARSVTFTVRS